MPIQKYLELDSTFRNRQTNPNPASFEVGMSQYGMRNQNSAIDPVSEAYPEIIFSPSQFTNNAVSAGLVYPKNQYFGSFDLLLPPSTPTTLYLSYTNSTTNPILSPKNQFMVGLSLTLDDPKTSNIAKGTFRRILEWEFLSEANNVQLFKATIDSSFNLTTLVSGNYSFIIPIKNQNAQLYFLPASLCIPNYYKNFILQNQSRTFSLPKDDNGLYVPQVSEILDFDRDSHYIVANPNLTIHWQPDDLYVIRREEPILSTFVISNNNTSTKLFVGTNFFENFLSTDQVLNSFINFYRLNGVDKVNVTAQIIAIDGVKTDKFVNGKLVGSYIIPDSFILSDSLPAVPILNDQYEILQCNRDNYSPFVYSGTMASNSQPVAYEMTLNSLTLPNRYLVAGGRIAYYPYVYVVIENISTTGGNAKNYIYSNNPNTYRAVFRVPITDLNHPNNVPFVKLTGNGMKQTIAFKQNDDMSMSVLLPNGEVFETEDSDNLAPGSIPNPTLQISGLFSMERIQ